MIFLFWRDVVDFRSEHIGERIVVSERVVCVWHRFTGTGYPYDSNGKSTVFAKQVFGAVVDFYCLSGNGCPYYRIQQIGNRVGYGGLAASFFTLVGIDLDRVFCLRSIDQKALYQAIWGVVVEGNYFSEQKIKKKTAPAKSKCCFQKS